MSLATSNGFSHTDLSGTMGALQIGSVFAIFIFGIVTLQTHMYAGTFADDKWQYKALVAIVWILELTHTTAVCYDVYRATIVLYGHPELLTTFPVLGSVTAVSGAITFLVQGYFSLRLYKVLPRPWCNIGLACIGLGAARFIASVYLAVKAATSSNIPAYRRDQGWLITILLSVGASVDVVIAISMLKYLAEKRAQGLQRMVGVVDRLIAYTIRSGLLTSVSAVVMLICFQAMPDNLVWLAIYTFLAKLYSNSLLSALNSRRTLRAEIGNSNSLPSVLPSIDRFARPWDATTTSPDAARFYGAQVISIEMKTTTETMHDEKDKPGPSFRRG